MIGKVLVTLMIVAVVTIDCNIVAQEKSSKWPCGKHPHLYKNSLGKPIWITFEELKKKALEMVSPEFPCCPRISGVVKLDVVIDMEGKIQCVRVAQGHPLVREAAIKAAIGWKFTPFKTNDSPVEVFAMMEFPYDAVKKE